ncbi:hypothetical protein B0H13DRAFT_2510882 [Mycena leptocephala]|nr:hypothetical protein B0H13DRAFT_2510882 [Mycena leptocephala]
MLASAVPAALFSILHSFLAPHANPLRLTPGPGSYSSPDYVLSALNDLPCYYGVSTCVSHPDCLSLVVPSSSCTSHLAQPAILFGNCLRDCRGLGRPEVPGRPRLAALWRIDIPQLRATYGGPWALRLIGHIVAGADVRKLNGMYVDDDLVAADSGGNLQGFTHAFCHGPVIGNCICDHSERGTWVSMRNKIHQQSPRSTTLLALPPLFDAHASCLPPSFAMSSITLGEPQNNRHTHHRCGNARAPVTSTLTRLSRNAKKLSKSRSQLVQIDEIHFVPVLVFVRFNTAPRTMYIPYKVSLLIIIYPTSSVLWNDEPVVAIPAIF